MDYVIDCIGLSDAQKEAGSMLMGGRVTDADGNTQLAAEFTTLDGYVLRDKFPEAYAELWQKASTPQTGEKSIEDIIRNGSYGNGYDSHYFDTAREALHRPGEVAVVGRWGDPLTQTVLECLALWRMLDTIEKEFGRQSITDFVHIVTEYRRDGFSGGGQSASHRPRTAMLGRQLQYCDDLQVLANSFGQLHLLSLFGDWLMEFRCIGRYGWYWDHQQDRVYMPDEKAARAAAFGSNMFGRPELIRPPSGYDDFVFMEFEPVGYYESINGKGSTPVVTILPWDDTAQPLFATLMAQRVSRPTFAQLDLVVLKQGMGVKLSLPTVAEIIS